MKTISRWFTTETPSSEEVRAAAVTTLGALGAAVAGLPVAPRSIQFGLKFTF